MGFDGITDTTAGFNPIRCNGALNKVFSTTFLLLVFKDSNEEFTDNLPLLLRFCDAFERLEVAVGGLDRDEVNALLFEKGFDLFGLVFPHEARVHIDAVKQSTNSLVGNDSSNR